MEIANLIIGILSLVVDIIMLSQVHQIVKNSISVKQKSNAANAKVIGKDNKIKISQE